jgi:hypothetical protein
MECPLCHADDAKLAYANPRRRVFSCPRCQYIWQALTHPTPFERSYEEGGRGPSEKSETLVRERHVILATQSCSSATSAPLFIRVS